MSTRRPVAVLFDHLGPYHRARLAAAGDEMDVTAVEIAGESATYSWEEVEDGPNFRRTTLFSERDSTSIPATEKENAIQEALNNIGPEVVAIPGWSYPRALAALRWCVHTGTPAVVMSASTAYDFDRPWWRERLKQRIVAHFGAGLVGGTRHRSYLQELGLSDDNIFLGYDAVENEHFTNGANKVRERGAAIRRDRSLPDAYFLGVCRFVPKKNLTRLIDAFARYRERAPDQAWDLVLLGDGPDRDIVEAASSEAGLEKVVHLPGFKQYDELPTYYGLAGAFVHASTREQWGLVVNEAMAAGLPVLVSDRCGCAPDLVEDGRNGFTFDPHDSSALAGLMARVAHGDVNRADMGAASQEIIEEWGPERFATGLKKAAEAALQAGPPSSSLLDRLLINALMYR
jgi:glycosyltransferase involved in cell wall biosynthesis